MWLQRNFFKRNTLSFKSKAVIQTDFVIGIQRKRPTLEVGIIEKVSCRKWDSGGQRR